MPFTRASGSRLLRRKFSGSAVSGMGWASQDRVTLASRGCGAAVDFCNHSISMPYAANEPLSHTPVIPLATPPAVPRFENTITHSHTQPCLPSVYQVPTSRARDAGSLMSRCMTPMLWQCATTVAMCLNARAASFSE